MTQKIVNVSEIERLLRYSNPLTGKKLIAENDLRALLDKAHGVSGEVVYQCAVRGNWMDTSLANYIKHTGVKRTLCTGPQPDRVAELEAKLKVAVEALDNIVKHFDLMGKSITEYSITYKIATEAIAKIEE